MMKIESLKLCYLSGTTYSGGLAYFTETMSSVHGDDWNDAPYWYNASEPYSNEPLLILAFRAQKLTTPKQANLKSISMNDMLSKQHPCLYDYSDDRWYGREYEGENALFLGATLVDFCDFIYHNHGEVLISLSQPELFKVLSSLNLTTKETQ